MNHITEIRSYRTRYLPYCVKFKVSSSLFFNAYNCRRVRYLLLLFGKALKSFESLDAHFKIRILVWSESYLDSSITVMKMYLFKISALIW
jgi:hypothetical protein